MLTSIKNNLLFRNADMIRTVVAAAQAAVNRVFANGVFTRDLNVPPNQTTLLFNALGTDERYLEAATAFRQQLEEFENELGIDK